jgi:hypothetical protein
MKLTYPTYSQTTDAIKSGLSSVTQENDLDEFLSTALLADTDFSAGSFLRFSSPFRFAGSLFLSCRASKH